MEKRIILLLLYCISLIGIGGKLFFDVRALGMAVASMRGATAMIILRDNSESLAFTAAAPLHP